MRCVAGAGLLALVGCNQVFGIANTTVYDASADVPVDIPFVRLTWQVAQVLPSGDPDPTIADVPISPPPKVRYAPLGGPFTDASYSAIDGSIAVAREFFTPPTTWRLEYTLADNVPHEVQWAPESKHGHLTVPMFGRADRDAVPSGSGYTIMPVGGKPPYTGPRVFTTGLWTEGVVNNYVSGATVSYDFANAFSMSGPTGRPDPTRGDRALLVDYRLTSTNPSCRVADGSAALDSAALQAGSFSMPHSAWDAQTRPVASDRLDTPAILGRLPAALGNLGMPPLQGSVSFGIAASTSMPGLPGVPVNPQVSPMSFLPAPAMVMLFQCPYNTAGGGAPQLPLTAQPVILDHFPRLLWYELVEVRTVALPPPLPSIALASGMETVIGATTSDGFAIVFPAAIPTAMTLTTPEAGVADLAGDSEMVAIGPARGSFTLGFTPEPDTALRADYYDVTLYRFDDQGALKTVRVFTVTAPRVQVDGSLFTPGAIYVFQVRSYKGHPNAQQGDFRPVDYPYGSAIVFTRTFTAS